MAEDWRADAACRGHDPDLWFPVVVSERGRRLGALEVAPEAVAICWSCPVDNECLDFAVPRPSIEGIWAGTTTADRSRMRTELGVTPIYEDSLAHIDNPTDDTGETAA